MFLQFNWDRLDATAAEAIRSLANAKLEEELQRRLSPASRTEVGDAPAEGGNGLSGVESICITNIEWGNVPPFVEVLDLDNALDFAGANAVANENLVARHEPGVVHLGTAMSTPLHLASVSASSTQGGECASESESCAGGGSSSSMTRRLSTTQRSCSQTQFNASSGANKDALAPFVGRDGLYICLHVTYGGPMRMSVSCVLRHDIPLGPTPLRVRMPLALHFSKIDMDFRLCINLHQNTCRIWMEPGKLSSSPITRMSVVAVFGERRPPQPTRISESTSGGGGGIPGTSDDLDTSEVWTHVGSSHHGSEEEGDVIFVDESVISQFVLREIREVMREKIIHPHFVVIPLFT